MTLAMTTSFAATPSSASPMPQRSQLHPSLIASLLRGNRVALLYGEAGAMRDATLRRGLMPLLGGRRGLRNLGRSEVAIRFDRWGTLPLEGLRAQIDAAVPLAWPAGPAPTLADHVGALCGRAPVTLLLVLDGFERHLREPATRADIAQFDRELAECITRAGLRLHLLMVVDHGGEPALHRYAEVVPGFGRDWLRLPQPAAADDDTEASRWFDTDIQALFDDERLIDDGAPRHEAVGGDEPIDLRLDEPGTATTTGDAPAGRQRPRGGKSGGSKSGRRGKNKLRAQPIADPRPGATPPSLPPSPPQQQTQQPLPTLRDALALDKPAGRTPTRAPLAASAHALPTSSASHALPAALPAWPPLPPAIAPASRDTWHETAPFVAPPVSALAADDPPSEPPTDWSDLMTAHGADVDPMDADAAATTPASRGASLGTAAHAGTASSNPLGAPAWPTEPDAGTLRRVGLGPTSWKRSVGVATYLLLLAVGAWFAADHILQQGRSVDGDARVAAAANGPATTRPLDAHGAAATPTAARAPAAAPGIALAVSLPPDAGSAPPLLAELARAVAAPAGITLKPVAGGGAAPLAVWRADMLQAARSAPATPVRVLSPLFTEQIQVLVRTDARWDYLSELRGLRIGIGRGDGARARTARTLYRLLFDAPLPAAAASASDEAAALQELVDGKVDALAWVSEQPLLAQLPPAQRRKVRELELDPRDGRTAVMLQTYPSRRYTPADKPRPTVTSYLVAADPVASADLPALRTLAAALCRVQPTLQARGSALLRGLHPNQQPAIGWPYLLPREPDGGCPGVEPPVALAQPRSSGG